MVKNLTQGHMTGMERIPDKHNNILKSKFAYLLHYPCAYCQRMLAGKSVWREVRKDVESFILLSETLL